MVQLTLTPMDAVRSLTVVLTALEHRARRSVGDGPHVAEASRATRQAFRALGPAPVSPAEERRIRAYFGAVLRRRVLSSRDVSTALARQRLLAVSMEADLVEAGWSRARARAEAERVLGKPEPAESVA